MYVLSLGGTGGDTLRHIAGPAHCGLAAAIDVTPGRVSQIERGEVATIDAIARYIEALGGRLDLVASFGDHTLIVATTEAA